MALPIVPLPEQSSLLQPEQKKNFQVSPADPALSVMTRFSKIRPFTIGSLTSLKLAHEKMIHCGVRLLFVSDEAHRIQGLITATDLNGEQPIQYCLEHGCTYDDILVRDVMTHLSRLEAFRYSDVIKATIDDLIKAMTFCQRQHMLVIDGEVVVGLFSTTQIEKQAGVSMPLKKVKYFHEIERALA